MKKFFLLLIVAVGGCDMDKNEYEDPIGDENVSEVSEYLIAEIVRENNSVVEFYEFEPGNIVVSGHGLAGTVPLTTELDITNLSAVDIYSYVAEGNDKIPEELIDAQLRSDADSQSKEIDENEIVLNKKRLSDTMDNSDNYYHSEHALNSGACDAEWFMDNLTPGCYTHKEDYCFGGHALNRTGGGTWYGDDSWSAWASTCPYRGTVTMKLHWRKNSLYDWENVSDGTWTVRANHYRWAWKTAGTYDDDYRFKITDADGDGYHRSFYYDWNCVVNCGDTPE